MPATQNKNKVKFGLSNVHIFPITAETDTETTYGPAIKYPGAVELALNVDEKEGKFYADNIAYYATYHSSGFSGDLTMAMITPEIWEKIYNVVKDAKGFETVGTGAKTTPCGITFQIEGDASPTVYQLFRCVLGRPSIAAKTIGESPEPETDKVALSVTPRRHDGNIYTRISADATGYATALTTMMTGGKA